MYKFYLHSQLQQICGQSPSLTQLAKIKAPRQRSYERVRPFDLDPDPPIVEPSYRRPRPEPLIREPLIREPSYRRPRVESPVGEPSYMRRRAAQSPPEDLRYRMSEAQSPFSPVVDFEYGFFYERPDSPTTTTTNSTTTGSTQSSSPSSILETHWLPAVFNQSRPTTAFGHIGQAFVHTVPSSWLLVPDLG